MCFSYKATRSFRIIVNAMLGMYLEGIEIGSIWKQIVVFTVRTRTIQIVLSEILNFCRDFPL